MRGRNETKRSEADCTEDPETETARRAPGAYYPAVTRYFCSPSAAKPVEQKDSAAFLFALLQPGFIFDPTFTWRTW